MKEFSDSTTARETVYGLSYKGVAPTPSPRGETPLSTLRSVPSVFFFFVVRFFSRSRRSLAC